jgi:hypothetical protein
MDTRLVNFVADAHDPSALAGFWSELLGWVIVGSPLGPTITLGAPVADACEFDLVLVPASERRSGKNRLHLDLAATTLAHQVSIVDVALRLGAARADIGQTGVPWEVLADPEGNEFCVLEPRAEYADTAALAAVVIDTSDAYALSGFWAAATGWPVAHRSSRYAGLRSSPRGPWLEFVHDEAEKRTRNRLHLELSATGAEPLRGVTSRFHALGAQQLPTSKPCPSGAEATLADPQGNEFCLLTDV